MRKNRRRHLILFLFALAFLGCQAHPAAVEVPLGADKVLRGVRHNLVLDGRELATILADSMYHMDGSLTVLLWGPDIDFSPSSPGQPPVFQGRQLVIDYENRSMTLRGEAAIEIPERGFRIQGDVLLYRYDIGAVEADSASVGGAPVPEGPPSPGGE